MKYLLVVFFPFIWIITYLYRIVVYDIIISIVKAFMSLFSGEFLGFFIHLLSIVLVVVDIFVGLVMTFIATIEFYKSLFSGQKASFKSLVKKEE